MDVSAITALSGLGRPSAAGNLTASAASPVDVQRKQVSAQFEAILVRQLLGKSIGSMLGGDAGVAGTVYGDMMTDVLAQKLTAGGGLGMARLIERQLTPRSPHSASPASVLSPPSP